MAEIQINISVELNHLTKLTLSTRMTFAPKSLKTNPQNGAGARPTISMTLIPRRAIGFVSLKISKQKQGKPLTH